MPDLKDFLPQPPWEGPPIPKGLSKGGKRYSPRMSLPKLMIYLSLRLELPLRRG